MMSQYVFEAIGKYINPKRYRQIIETGSVQNLSPDEQKWVTEDQKHSSNVARTHYQKKRSRDIALRGQCCMNKLHGKAGEVLDKSLEEISKSSKSYSSDGDIISDQENEQTYSEKIDVIYSNTTDTVISNKGSSTSRSLSINNTKSKAALFIKKEYQNLLQGLRRHGHGNWVAILRDSLLDFYASRTPNALTKRVTSKTFQKLL